MQAMTTSGNLRACGSTDIATWNTAKIKAVRVRRCATAKT